MADIMPVTREEFYLAKAGGQNVPVPSAVTREEYYLEKLSNDSVVVPTPVTRREKFLYFASGGEIDLPSEEKMTRLERLIAKAGGMDVSTPTAVTRLEKFWANVEAGGWKTITGVLPLTFTAKGGTAADWVIYGNAQGVGEQRVDGYYVPLTISQRPIYPIQRALKGKSVRDQITTTKGNETLTWDIIGIDHDECYYPDGTRAQHTATIQLHDVYIDLQYCARQAAFAFAEGLAAGTYKFTVGTHPWVAGDVNKVLTFTLANDIAAGGQLVFNAEYNATLVDTTISVFASPTSTTAAETVTMTEGDTGTDLGTILRSKTDAINSIDRALLGSNNWLESAMRQYLNSDKAAGSVWTPQSVFDRPPTRVSSTAGFLNGMDEDFVKAVGTVKKKTGLNTISDGGGTATHDEKVFLLSRSEVFMGDEYAGGEDTPYAYYKNYSDNQSASTGADKNRIKYRAGAAKYWLLRSPDASSARNVGLVSPSGAWHSSSAVYGLGVAPACCIPLDEVYDSHEYDIYIGDSPLTEGETVSKTSTGQDIELFGGENTVSTTLYNKPEMMIKYKE